MQNTCRCGFVQTELETVHPCHGNKYTCRKPAKQRFYVPHWNFALAGVQMKVSAADTWACDECWSRFKP